MLGALVVLAGPRRERPVRARVETGSVRWATATPPESRRGLDRGAPDSASWRLRRPGQRRRCGERRSAAGCCPCSPAGSPAPVEVAYFVAAVTLVAPLYFLPRALEPGALPGDGAGARRGRRRRGPPPRRHLHPGAARAARPVVRGRRSSSRRRCWCSSAGRHSPPARPCCGCCCSPRTSGRFRSRR